MRINAQSPTCCMDKWPIYPSLIDKQHVSCVCAMGIGNVIPYFPLLAPQASTVDPRFIIILWHSLCRYHKPAGQLAGFFSPAGQFARVNLPGLLRRHTSPTKISGIPFPEIQRSVSRAFLLDSWNCCPKLENTTCWGKFLSAQVLDSKEAFGR